MIVVLLLVSVVLVNAVTDEEVRYQWRRVVIFLLSHEFALTFFFFFFFCRNQKAKGGIIAAMGGAVLAVGAKVSATALIPTVMSATGTVIAGTGTIHGAATVAVTTLGSTAALPLVAGGAAVGYGAYWMCRSVPGCTEKVSSGRAWVAEAAASAMDAAAPHVRNAYDAGSDLASRASASVAEVVKSKSTESKSAESK
jgi:hypothetical protein